METFSGFLPKRTALIQKKTPCGKVTNIGSQGAKFVENASTTGFQLDVNKYHAPFTPLEWLNFND